MRCLAVMSLAVLGLGGDLQAGAQSSPRWSLSVRPFQQEVEKGQNATIWMVLVNRNGDEAALCVEWVTFELVGPDGESAAGGVRGRMGVLSPHKCQSDADRYLVPAGQTLQPLISIPTRELEGDCRLTVRVRLIDACTGSKNCVGIFGLGRTTTLSAEGTIKVRPSPQ